MTKNELEKALDSGTLWAKMGNGRWWKVRRNGRTQVWVRKPAWRIPVKAGLRACGELTQDSNVTVMGDGAVRGDWIVSSFDPS